MPQLGNVRAVILDFDGTLAHASYDFEAMRRAVARLGARYGVPPDSAKGMRVLETVEAIQRLAGEAGAQFRAEAERIMRDIELKGARQGRVLPRALGALARLKARGFKIAVITRNCSEAVETILRGRELPCHCLLTRDNVTRPKPHPQHLLKALSALRCERDRAIVVGDHPMDMEAGKRVGLRTVGVLTGAGTRAELLDAGADLVVRSVATLARMLLNREPIRVG